MLTSHRRDQFIEFIKGLLQHSFVLDALEESAANSWKHIEELIEEHRLCSDGSSRLAQAVPTIGEFFTPLPLAATWAAFDARYRVSRRRFVQPSFNEIRQILNEAQVRAFAGEARPGSKNRSSLDFVSFDGDCTLYSDGKNFNDPKLAAQILRLLEAGVVVALVTAAGYGYEAARYEKRLDGLLRVLAAAEPEPETLRRFFVVGGESNYLLQLEQTPGAHHNGKISLVSRADLWDTLDFVAFDETEVTTLLDVAEATITHAIADLGLPDARVVRKPRAVGLLPVAANREQLDETVLRVQEALRRLQLSLPYCAFNGGSDVFVDIGNKKVGVQGLQALLHLQPKSCLHIGDQFLNTGNDYAARSASCCLWITNPDETKAILHTLLDIVDPHAPTSRSPHHPPTTTPPTAPLSPSRRPPPPTDPLSSSPPLPSPHPASSAPRSLREGPSGLCRRLLPRHPPGFGPPVLLARHTPRGGSA